MLSFIARLFGSHLRIGDRVRLSGGYDMEPRWLNGRDSLFGKCISFVPSEDSRSAAVIQLDEPITFDSVTGSYAVLRLRYVGARWSKREIVHLELFAAPPASLQEAASRGLWIESHASYRSERPNTSFKPTPQSGAAQLGR